MKKKLKIPKEGWRRVVLESPLSGDVDRNMEYLRRAELDSISRGESPYASHRQLTKCLNDLDAKERLIGMSAGRAWYTAAQMCVVYMDYGMSSGMQIGVAHAREIGLEIEERLIGKNKEAEVKPRVSPPKWAAEARKQARERMQAYWAARRKNK